MRAPPRGGSMAEVLCVWCRGTRGKFSPRPWVLGTAHLSLYHRDVLKLNFSFSRYFRFT